MRHTRVDAAIMAFLLLGALSGCAAPKTPAPTPATTAPAPSASASATSGALSVPTDVPNDPAVRKAVTISDCAAADNGWKASGTATNSGDTGVTYTVTVFFTTDQATVIGTGEATVKVDPGKSGDWSVTAPLAGGDKAVCVLRGVSAH